MKISPVIALVFCVFTSAVSAQNQGVLKVNVRVESRCKIEIGSHSVSFTRVEPDLTAAIQQNEPAINISVKLITAPGEKVYLRLQALDELISDQGFRIDLPNITWQAAGEGFINGSLSHVRPQILGEWSRSGVYTGTIRFSMANRLQYAPGIYNLRISLSMESF